MPPSSDKPVENIRTFRPDFATLRRSQGDTRSPERLLAHYCVERELSDRLRHAPREERLALYGTLYQQLFEALPDHPQRTPRDDRQHVGSQLPAVIRYLEPTSIFLEIGCGNAALTFAAARHVRTAYGVDVTDALIDVAAAPENFVFLCTSGVEIPLPGNTIDFAYSYQFMEHLHPDDAIDQLREIYRVLKSGGRYLCVTPSQITGPHDISMYFDYEAAGLHLKEYQYADLRSLCQRVGFRKFSCRVFLKGREVGLPYPVLRAMELGMRALPVKVGAKLAQTRIAQAVMGLNAVITK
jgi:SAM-dependent methyltransferase